MIMIAVDARWNEFGELVYIISQRLKYDVKYKELTGGSTLFNWVILISGIC